MVYQPENTTSCHTSKFFNLWVFHSLKMAAFLGILFPRFSGEATFFLIFTLRFSKDPLVFWTHKPAKYFWVHRPGNCKLKSLTWTLTIYTFILSTFTQGRLSYFLLHKYSYLFLLLFLLYFFQYLPLVEISLQSTSYLPMVSSTIPLMGMSFYFLFNVRLHM